MRLKDIRLGKIDITKSVRNLSELECSAEDYQYKDGCDENGVVDDLTDAKFNSLYLGSFMAHRKKDKLYIINGHHRYAKALACEELDTEVFVDEVSIDIEKVLPNKYSDLDESEKEEAEIKIAKVLGACVNIADGNGRVVDAAMIFRTVEATKEDLKDKGISLNKSIADAGMAVANLHKDVFESYLNGNLSLAKAIIIGKNIDDRDKQVIVHNMLNKKKNLNNDAVKGLCKMLTNNDLKVEIQQEQDMSFFAMLGEEKMESEEAVMYVETVAKIKNHFKKGKNVAKYNKNAEEYFNDMNMTKDKLGRLAEDYAKAETIVNDFAYYDTPLRDDILKIISGESETVDVIGIIKDRISEGNIESMIKREAQDEEIEASVKVFGVEDTAS
ncbi:MAG: hypothetical protein N4A47_01075 [Clostridia bacterium]|jgi:ribosomal protein L24|nr:hypothetical protein [Clostridia bacterium]